MNPIPHDAHHPERLAKAGIPPRFRRKTLESYVADTPAQQDALAWAIAFANSYRIKPSSYLLVGKPGTGKTHLAIGIALEALYHNYVEEVQYTTVQRAIRRIKESWGDRGETERAARSTLTEPRLLILDEVGLQTGSEFEIGILTEVVNERYEHQKPTILVSNLSHDETLAFLGERIIDRLREDGGRMIVFDWESHRGKSIEDAKVYGE